MIKSNKINVILLSIALLASSLGFTANAASAPTLGDQSATVTGSHNASLSIFVNPNGGSTVLHFQYWTGSNFKERLYMGVTGTSSVRIEVGLINLLEGSNYSYKVVAENSYGTVTGSTGTFTTMGGQSSAGSTSSTSNNNSSNNNSNNTSNSSTYNNSGTAGLPSVTTNGPVSVSASSAVINGSVNSNGNATNFWFELGTTTSLGQTTTTQYVGNDYSWQLVTGNLSNLQNNTTYYYRVAAQNNYGINRGEIRSFITGQTSGTGTGTGQSSNGQVLGAVSGSGTGSSSSSSKTSSGTSGTSTATKSGSTTKTAAGSRPSFISLEYSLDANGALVSVASNLKPKPGEEFSYTIISKNDTQYSFNEATLKVILPTEVDYINSNADPLRISGTMIEFDLGTIAPMSQTATVITVKVKETAKPGTSMIFTSVLGYKDRTGTQLATTSYLTVKVGQDGSGISLSAFSLGSLVSSTGVLVLIALVFLSLMALLTYKLLKMRNGKSKNKKSEEDIFTEVPPTFEPVSDESFPRR